jgi:hypothetical protein
MSLQAEVYFLRTLGLRVLFFMWVHTLAIPSFFEIKESAGAKIRYEKTRGSPFLYFFEACADCNIEFRKRTGESRHPGHTNQG